MGLVSGLIFSAYEPAYRGECLALFDANCPRFFAPNERADYEVFLGKFGDNYLLALARGAVVGAFGVTRSAPGRAALRWIMLAPGRQGSGLGRAMMAETEARARALGASVLDIAASHVSAPFFAHLGAVELSRTPDGWGPGMHRVDMERPLHGVR